MDRPLPPEELCYRVSGTRNLDWFDRSGKITVDLYAKGLSTLGRGFTEFTDIYD